MAFTLAEALTMDCLKNSRVIAGNKGLDREIRFVNVMEVPDIIDWVSEKELLLTTGYPFKDSSMNFIELIQKLSNKKLTGLAIKTQRFFDSLPQGAIEISNKLNFPLIELAPEAHFNEIIRSLLGEVINRDYLVIKRTEQIHQIFTDLVLSGGEFNEIAAALANLCHGKVQITDAFDRVLAEAQTQGEPDKKYGKPGNEGELGSKGEIEKSIVQRPVHLNNEIAAYIIIKFLGKPAESEDIVAIDRAATIVALVLLKKQAAAEVEKKYRNDFLNNLVNGEIDSRETVLQRGAFFNLDLTLPYLLFLIDVGSFDEIYLKNLRKNVKGSHNPLGNLFYFVFKNYFSKAGQSIVWDRSDSIVVLYPLSDSTLEKEGKDVKNLSCSIAEQIKRIIDENIEDFTVTIGMGTFYPDIMEIKNSYREALTAIRVGKSVWGNNGTYHYDDLGAYRILAQFPDKKELRNFTNTMIGSLQEYDQKRGTKLLFTLEQFFANDNNQRLTAEKLFIHPKTLSYRLSKIEEILGAPLNNPELRFSLYMALKIMKMADI